MKMVEYKTINPYFTDVWNGDKTFEIRKDDRPDEKLEVGDLVWLREYDVGYPSSSYTGRSVLADVRYMIPAGKFEGLSDGYCAMGIYILQRKTE